MVAQITLPSIFRTHLGYKWYDWRFLDETPRLALFWHPFKYNLF